MLRRETATGRSGTPRAKVRRRSRAAEAVDSFRGRPVAAGAAVELQELPAVEAATLVYRGPYDGMEPSWRHLMEWVGRSGRQPGGPMREVYLSDPDTVASQDLLTELVVSVA